jgi:exo-1,4-beta-D-glucosaminidase
VASNEYLGEPKDDVVFKTDLTQRADLSALNTITRAVLKTSVKAGIDDGENTATLALSNLTNRIAFFVRAQIIAGDKGEVILPITYTDNYLTVMPRESNRIVATYDAPAILDQATELRIDGYNVNAQSLPLGQAERDGFESGLSGRKSMNVRELGNRHEKIDR